LDRLGHGIDMPRGAGHGLRQHSAVQVEHTSREVAALAHDRAEGRAQQNLCLFLDHGDQPVPHDLLIDQTRAAWLAHGYAAFRSMTMLPAPSIWASKLVETNVDVSSSVITAGPSMVAPGAIWSRRYSGISTTFPARPSKNLRLPPAFPAGLRVTSATRDGLRGSVVASTDQLSTSIAAPGIGRSNKAA